jgi:hypothetical protein
VFTKGARNELELLWGCVSRLVTCLGSLSSYGKWGVLNLGFGDDLGQVPQLALAVLVDHVDAIETDVEWVAVSLYQVEPQQLSLDGWLVVLVVEVDMLRFRQLRSQVDLRMQRDRLPKVKCTRSLRCRM